MNRKVEREIGQERERERREGNMRHRTEGRIESLAFVFICDI